MASREYSILPPRTLPPHCTPTTSFLNKASVYFGVCLPTPLGFISTLFGNLSILSWLFAQMPQIYKNYEIKSTAGLSAIFLFEWLLGDLTNLLGGVFTEQATWQVVLASYYVFVDVCLVFQYFWYTYLLPTWRDGSIHSYGSDTDDDNDDANSDIINSLSPINSNFAEHDTTFAKSDDVQTSEISRTQPVNTPRFSEVHYEKNSATPSTFNSTGWRESKWSGPSPRTTVYATAVLSLANHVTARSTNHQGIVHQSAAHTRLEIAGIIISWCSTLLYFGSRLPQLYKNWRRKSTTGLSPYLFMATFSGNFFYSASLLTNPNAWNNFGPFGGHGWADEDGSERITWIRNAAPFFLGAFGVLFFDALMGVQFLLYSDRQEKLVKVRDGYGFGRWQIVSGWMRGWIPSMTKEKVVGLAESQRLLAESRDLDRHGHHSQYGGI